MKVSFRTWLTLILVLVNALVLGSLAAWTAVDERGLRLQQLADLERQVRERFSDRFEPERAGDLAEMLDWPLWPEFEDAVILDHRVLDLGGAVTPVGAWLNPRGRRNRRADFPMQGIAEGITLAMRSGQPTPVAAGLALPLHTADRRVWGGIYVRLPGAGDSAPLSRRVLLAAVAATLLGAGLIYLLVGRAVITPVERLAAAAHEFGAGRDPVLPGDAGTAEMQELLTSFRAMMARIRGFQGELKLEVEAATERAADAERRAARQERLAALGTLAAGLAHEINSPLAGALQGIETLRKEARSDRGRRYGQLTQDALERIRGLVQRLLQLAPARIETGECVLQDVFRDLPAFVESRLGRHRLEFTTPEAPLRVSASPGDLFPVLLNLLQNALDALDARPQRPGTVRVAAAAMPGGGAVVRVTDDGPGADPALLPRLFEPFVTDKDVGHGTGLGLALAYATVRQLGGSLEAANRPEGGLEVVLRIPGPESGA